MTRPQPVVRLDRKSAAIVQRGHPWIWLDPSAPELKHHRPGDEVRLVDPMGTTVGRALFDGGGGPSLRVISRDPEDPPLARLLRQRIRAARAVRAAVVPRGTDAFRLVHGEGDRLPGLVIDRYGEVCVVRPDGPLWAPHLEEVRQILLDEERPRCIWLAGREGPSTLLAGTEVRECVVTEQGRRYLVRPGHGQKTGFFLDQRPNRDHVEALAPGVGRALNLFSFTGGFTVAMARGGATHVTSVDVAEAILEDCRAQLPLNDLDPAPHEFLAVDAFRWLPATARHEPFDLVVCDPPSLAHRQADLKAARDASFRLHRALAARLARPAMVVTASCTSRLSAADHLSDAVGGLRAGGRPVDRVLREGGAGADHPIYPAWTEGRYLSCQTLWVP